jgi:hypothetical protein
MGRARAPAVERHLDPSEAFVRCVIPARACEHRLGLRSRLICFSL